MIQSPAMAIAPFPIFSLHSSLNAGIYGKLIGFTPIITAPSSVLLLILLDLLP